MNRDDVVVEFERFHPAEELRALFHQVAERLCTQSPSDADLRMVVRKVSEKFKVYCRISSSVGVFIAEESAENAEGILAKIEKQIGRQLSNWRRRRFVERETLHGGAA